MLVVIGALFAVVGLMLLAAGVQTALDRWWWRPPIRSLKAQPRPDRSASIGYIVWASIVLFVAGRCIAS